MGMCMPDHDWLPGQVFLLKCPACLDSSITLCVVRSLTLLFEGEVLGEVPALVVASEQEQRGRVVDLQRPQVEHALRKG